MSVNGVPEDARRLLASRINSVEQLEILLLLRRDPARSWTPSALAEELRSSEPSVAKRLADLRRGGLVEVVPSSPEAYRYAPAAAWLSAAVDSLAQLYAESPYRVIDLIFAKPIDNLRVYADAFRYRKDDSDG
ncbi:MAG TPA: winged helix-turn-helix domain-containing protein [Sandaracinaceae bacterium]